MFNKTIMLENLVAFNKAVQNSGGIMGIKSSWTDSNRDVHCYVIYTRELTEEAEKIYEQNKVIK